MSGRAARKSRRWTWAHSLDVIADKVFGRPENRAVDAKSVARRYNSARKMRRLEDARRAAHRKVTDWLKRHRKPTGHTLRWGGQSYYPKHVTERFDKLREQAITGIVAALLLVVVL